MGSRGNKSLKKESAISNQSTLHCARCDTDYDINEFYDSDSELYRSVCKIPYCKRCIDKLYDTYINHYKKMEYLEPDRKAIERLCMVFDLYYADKVFNAAIKESETKPDTSIVSLYIKHVKLYQYRNKDYNSTIHERFRVHKDMNEAFSIFSQNDIQEEEDIKEATRLFGRGFAREDYLFLHDQYIDWTTRHECETKTQEEMFKQICFTQLELLKKNRAKEDTKDLNATFLKQLEAAKLQPKQNKGETMSDAQTFGTLLDKWETTRPLPEVEEDLRDVDKLGLYIDVFFRGHLAKMMGLKNGLSNLYTKFIKKYTVSKPEYDNDEDSEILFDAIFGSNDDVL